MTSSWITLFSEVHLIRLRGGIKVGCKARFLSLGSNFNQIIIQSYYSCGNCNNILWSRNGSEEFAFEKFRIKNHEMETLLWNITDSPVATSMLVVTVIGVTDSLSKLNAKSTQSTRVYFLVFFLSFCGIFFKYHFVPEKVHKTY